jgi:hypothetical protein
MNPLRQIFFRLWLFFRRRKIEAELSEELRVHLEMAAEANIAAGRSAEKARYAAQRQFGGVVDQIKETYRDVRGIRWSESCHRPSSPPLARNCRLATASLSGWIP